MIPFGSLGEYMDFSRPKGFWVPNDGATHCRNCGAHWNTHTNGGYNQEGESLFKCPNGLDRAIHRNNQLE